MKHTHIRIPLPVLYPTDDESHAAAMLFFDDDQPWPYRDDDDAHDAAMRAFDASPSTTEDNTHG